MASPDSDLPGRSIPRVLLICAGVVVLGAAAALYFIDPEGGAGAAIPKCPFKLLTTLDCPSCGVQRALHHLLHGRLTTALSYNPFMTLAALYALLLACTTWLDRRTKTSRLRRILTSRPALYTYVAAYLLWGVARNLLGI